MLETFFNNPSVFTGFLAAIVIAITIHEFAHAVTADYLGDPTPRIQGRVTLNPKAHLDLFGMAFILFFGFGWGRPVIYDPFNLKNPRKDSAIISLAGPLSNIIIAIISSIIMRLFIFFDLSILNTIGMFLLMPLIQVNLILAIFNLIPIHPLDGFKIIGGILSPNQAKEWYQLEKYGFLFLLLLVVPIGQQSMASAIIQPIIKITYSLLIP